MIPHITFPRNRPLSYFLVCAGALVSSLMISGISFWSAVVALELMFGFPRATKVYFVNILCVVTSKKILFKGLNWNECEWTKRHYYTSKFQFRFQTSALRTAVRFKQSNQSNASVVLGQLHHYLWTQLNSEKCTGALHTYWLIMY